MQSRLIPWAFAVAVLSIPVIGYVQYRWIDRVSETELNRETQRLTDNLGRVETAFDTEITRVEFWFSERPQREDSPQQDSVEGAVERLQQWTARAQYPSIVEAVLLLQGDGTAVRVSPGGGTDTISLPSEPDERGPVVLLNGTYALRIRRGRGGPPGRFFEGGPFRHPPGAGSGSPRLPRPQHHDGEEKGERYRERLILLDREALRNELLPALLARYLGQESYDTELREGNAVLARTRISGGTPDASVGLFAVRPDCLFGDEREGFGRRRRGPPPWERGIDVPARNTRAGNCRPLPSGAPEALWTLHAWHPAGSLATAVESLRTRNLAASFGVLACLAGALVALWVATRRASSLARRQMEFAMSVSHELRTPLTVMRLAGDNLAQGVATSPDQVRRYGEMIRGESERLGGMVEQILTFARAERTDFAIRPECIQTADIAEAALRATEPLLRNAGFEVEKDIALNLPPVCADLNLLVSALTNLIVNAVRHAAGGNWVGVRVTSDGRTVAFEIADRGPGVPLKEHHKIFRPFYRGTGAGSTVGTGLGLHLVRRIAEAHHGSVRLDSHAGSGTRVTISLPAFCEAKENAV